MAWDPQQYAAFAAHRGRPFADLLARVGADDPALVVDLGLRDGRLTLRSPDRWPGARVSASTPPRRCSSRAAGRRRAASSGSRPTRPTWDPLRRRSVDVLVTQRHAPVGPRATSTSSRVGRRPRARRLVRHAGARQLRRAVAPLMREVAAASPVAATWPPALRPARPWHAPAYAAPLLRAASPSVDVWETTYQHVLDRTGAQRSPVLEWVRGTGLRPVLDG